MYERFLGKNVMVRTVTMIFVGTLTEVGIHEIALTNVSWIPETDRWQWFIADGSIRECEPYPDEMEVILGRGAIIDVCEWRSALPRTQK